MDGVGSCIDLVVQQFDFPHLSEEGSVGQMDFDVSVFHQLLVTAEHREKIRRADRKADTDRLNLNDREKCSRIWRDVVSLREGGDADESSLRSRDDRVFEIVLCRNQFGLGGEQSGFGGSEGCLCVFHGIQTRRLFLIEQIDPVEITLRIREFRLALFDAGFDALYGGFVLDGIEFIEHLSFAYDVAVLESEFENLSGDSGDDVDHRF